MVGGFTVCTELPRCVYDEVTRIRLQTGRIFLGFRFLHWLHGYQVHLIFHTVGFIIVTSICTERKSNKLRFLLGRTPDLCSEALKSVPARISNIATVDYWCFILLHINVSMVARTRWGPFSSIFIIHYHIEHLMTGNFHKNDWVINPLNPELNPICYLLALLTHHFLHVSRIRVKSLTIRLLMSYIYGAPTLDVSRSYTTTHHSR